MMRLILRAVCLFCLATLVPACTTGRGHTSLSSVEQPAGRTSSLVRVDAVPEAGFHWPYYLWMPDGPARGLLVETNNTGAPNDDFAAHDAAALSGAERLGHLARQLGCAALMPVFPRPARDWRVLTHALDRDTVVPTPTPTIALSLTWMGPPLEPGSGFRYHLPDVVVLQDDLPFLAVASDFPPDTPIHDVQGRSLTFFMEPGWDRTRAFTFAELVPQ